jgi:hypothetical protein
VLKRFVAVRQAIEMFINEKWEVFVEVIDEILLWDLVLLCDIRER